jgi:hypothetical protein
MPFRQHLHRAYCQSPMCHSLTLPVTLEAVPVLLEVTTSHLLAGI